MSVTKFPQKSGTYYEARVLYRYEVGGQKYLGTREAVHPPKQRSESEAVHYAASTYPPGSTHDVFYDPDDPSEFVLLNPVVNLRRTEIVCAIFGTIGLVLLGVALHEWQQNRPLPKKNARFLQRASQD